VNEVDAALAYDQAARAHLKEKAKLNFPDLPPRPQVTSNDVSTKRARGEQVRPNAGQPPTTLFV
jgi:hypothetical protein